jgi:hypothetical protein
MVFVVSASAPTKLSTMVAVPNTTGTEALGNYYFKVNVINLRALV